MKGNRNNNNASFLLNQINLFNHQKDKSEVGKQWHCFDKIIFKKIEELQSKAFYFHKGTKLKPIKVRFNNSILNSFEERHALNRSLGERNKNSQYDHYIASNSLPHMNNNNLNNYNRCCHSNRNIQIPEINNSYSMQSYNTKSTDRLSNHALSSSSFIPNLNDFLCFNQKLNIIHKNQLNADLVLVIKSIKTNELDNKSLSSSIDGLSNRRNNSNSDNKQCDKSTGTTNTANEKQYRKNLNHYPLKRIKLVKGSNFEEKYNVSNCDYTILSKRSPLKKLTNTKNKDKEGDN